MPSRASSSATVASASASVGADRTTFMPRSASAIAVARPRPRLAPVTSATRSRIARSPSAADDRDVEIGGLQGTPHSQPQRQIHLGPARAADVAEIDDRLPAEPVAQDRLLDEAL